MTDIVIPAGAVVCRDGDPVLTKKAQVAISGGQGVYIDLTNAGKFNLADADALASSKLAGVAVGDAAAGEYCTIALPGSVITVVSSTFSIGVVYYVSTTAGGFAPFADLASGDYPTIGLMGITATTALVVGTASGVTI